MKTLIEQPQHGANESDFDKQPSCISHFEIINGDETLGTKDHLKFSFLQHPSYEDIKLIASHFVGKLNKMNTSEKYTIKDNSQTLKGTNFEYVEFQIQLVHPSNTDLNSVHFRVSRNTNPSLGNSVDIFVDGFKSEKDDLVNKLRAYTASLV